MKTYDSLINAIGSDLDKALKGYIGEAFSMETHEEIVEKINDTLKSYSARDLLEPGKQTFEVAVMGTDVSLGIIRVTMELLPKGEEETKGCTCTIMA